MYTEFIKLEMATSGKVWNLLAVTIRNVYGSKWITSSSSVGS